MLPAIQLNETSAHFQYNKKTGFPFITFLVLWRMVLLYMYFNINDEPCGAGDVRPKPLAREEMGPYVVCGPNTYCKHSHGHQCWIQLNIKFIIFSKEREQQTVALSWLNTPWICWPLIYWKKPAGKNILCSWLMSASVISFHLDSWPALTSPPWRIQKNLRADPRALLAWDLQNVVFAK